MKNFLLILFYIVLLSSPVNADSGLWMLPQAKQDFNNQEYVKVIETTTKIISLNQSNADIYLLRAKAEMELNNISSALNDITKSINLKPSSETYAIRAYLKALKNDETVMANIANDISDSIRISNKKSVSEAIYYACKYVNLMVDSPNISTNFKMIIYTWWINCLAEDTTSIMNESGYPGPIVLFYAKFVQFVALLDENDPAFKMLNLSKQKTLETINYFANTKYKGSDDFIKIVLDDIMCAVYQYAIGNTDIAKQMFKGTKNRVETKYAGNIGGPGSTLLMWIDSVYKITASTVDNKLKTMKKVYGIGIIPFYGTDFNAYHGPGIVIAEVVPNSPAYNAGLKPHDRISLIDNHYTHDNGDVAVSESMEYTLGEKGSVVYLIVNNRRYFIRRTAEVKITDHKLHAMKSYEYILPENETYGIGVLLENDENNNILIKDVLSSTPAYKIGIKKNDKILKINNENVIGLDINEVKQRILGKYKTTVTLLIQRGKREHIYNIIRTW